MKNRTALISIDFRSTKPEACKEYLTNKGLLKYDVRTSSFYNERGSVKVSFWYKEVEELEEVAIIISKFFEKKKLHPHMKLIADQYSSELLEGVKSEVMQYE